MGSPAAPAEFGAAGGKYRAIHWKAKICRMRRSEWSATAGEKEKTKVLVQTAFLEGNLFPCWSWISKTYVVLSQEIRTKLQVIIQIKRATSLETSSESSNSGSLGQFSHALHTTELTLGILLGHFRSPTATVVMILGGHMGVGVLLLLVVVVVVVVESRHRE